MATLSPALLFPFCQPARSPSSPTSSSSSSCPFAFSLPCTSSASTTTTTHDTSCTCHAVANLTASTLASATYIAVPSANSHQPLLLPLPQPPAPPVVSSTTSADGSASSDQAGLPGPITVFSHGSTQVDTLVPSARQLQRTVFSWSQLADYTPKHCWELPATSSSTSTECGEKDGQQQQQQREGSARHLSLTSANGRICQGDDVDSCPGHPWIQYSYHLEVKQWQEATEADETAASAPSLVDSAPLTRCQSERDRSWRKRRLVVHGGCDVAGYTDSDSDSDSASECDSDSDGTSGSSGGSDDEGSSRGGLGGCAGGNSVLAALLSESGMAAARMRRVHRRTL